MRVNSGARVAVVTGASRGIGFATARRLAEDGAAVVLADLDEKAGIEAAAALGDDGHDARFHLLDVASPPDWAGLVDGLARLDILVSNASVARLAPAGTLSDSDWATQIEVGLSATFFGFRAVLPLLLDGGGAVVVTSSVHALFGLPGRPAYAAAKGGLVALARQLAVEYGPTVRVNAVLPGPIRTDPWDGVAQADVERSAHATVAGRLGDPSEVAAAISFLASEDASYITGASLVVDGGWTICKDSV